MSLSPMIIVYLLPWSPLLFTLYYETRSAEGLSYLINVMEMNGKHANDNTLVFSEILWTNANRIW